MKRLMLSIMLGLAFLGVGGLALAQGGPYVTLYSTLPVDCGQVGDGVSLTGACSGEYCYISHTIYFCVANPMTMTVPMFAYGRPGGSAFAYAGEVIGITPGYEPNRVEGAGCSGTYLSYTETVYAIPDTIYQITVGGMAGAAGCTYGPDAFGEIEALYEVAPVAPSVEEILALTPPPEEEYTGQGVTGLPLPSFYSGVESWFDYAQKTINIVNRGNLLYVIAGILTAGIVLDWVIRKVKNPDSL